MGAFLIGVLAAVVLAVVSVLGLNAVAQSTPDAFYTRNTVPLDYKVPTDGSLDAHAAAHTEGKSDKLQKGN